MKKHDSLILKDSVFIWNSKMIKGNYYTLLNSLYGMNGREIYLKVNNMINNYNMVMNGTADIVSVMQSGFISGMIGELEAFIPEAELEKMNAIMVKVQYGDI